MNSISFASSHKSSEKLQIPGSRPGGLNMHVWVFSCTLRVWVDSCARVCPDSCIMAQVIENGHTFSTEESKMTENYSRSNN